MRTAAVAAGLTAGCVSGGPQLPSQQAGSRNIFTVGRLAGLCGSLLHLPPRLLPAASGELLGWPWQLGTVVSSRPPPFIGAGGLITKLARSEAASAVEITVGTERETVAMSAGRQR